MHTVHHTRAVVLRSQPSREADKIFWLFTQDFGVVSAVATGIRKPHAKLAPQLVEYAFVDVDLVKGRDVWRLVSATFAEQPLASKLRRPLARAYVRILGAVYRFLGEEGEPHEALFLHTQECAALLSREDIDAHVFDTLGIWRVLAHLGYIAIPSEDTALFSDPLQETIARIASDRVRAMIEEVHTAIGHTHL